MRKEMRRHKYADLIHAWAEGAIIQCKLDQSDWIDLKYPVFTDGFKYRIKPKEPEWWENIPEHGVLVKSKITANVFAITSYDGIPNPELYVPLTNEEIESFKR